MSARNVALTAGTWFLLAVVQLLTALGPPAVAVIGGLAVGLLGFAVLRFFDVEFESPWVPALVATLASVIGVSIRWIGAAEELPWTLWLGPVVATIAAAAFTLVKNVRVRRCELCNRRIGSGEVVFVCPRCGLQIGDAGGCWVHERLRCRLCEQNQVPILPADKRWWDRQFGARVMRGRCQVTLEDAAETDLRACPHCGRLQSTLAWDMNNGQCARCGWTLEELPSSLLVYMGATTQRDVWAEERGRGRRRPSY